MRHTDYSLYGCVNPEELNKRDEKFNQECKVVFDKTINGIKTEIARAKHMEQVEKILAKKKK